MRIRNYREKQQLILVLNSDYLPVNVTTFKKAYKLVYKGKAQIIEEMDDKTIITDKNKFQSPSIIRLIKYVNIPYRKVILSRENIFKRDNHTCAYCGSNKNLTVDHIYPKSKGGKNEWENLITCCFKCNSDKGDRTLEQSGFKLLYTPTKPHPISFMYHSHKNVEKWQPYLMF